MPTPAQNRATAKYMRENYDRLDVKFKKESKMLDVLNNHVKEYDYKDSVTGRYSKAEFVKRAIETQLAIDRGEIKIVRADEE